MDACGCKDEPLGSPSHNLLLQAMMLLAHIQLQSHFGCESEALHDGEWKTSEKSSMHFPFA